MGIEKSQVYWYFQKLKGRYGASLYRSMALSSAKIRRRPITTTSTLNIKAKDLFLLQITWLYSILIILVLVQMHKMLILMWYILSRTSDPPCFFSMQLFLSSSQSIRTTVLANRTLFHFWLRAIRKEVHTVFGLALVIPLLSEINTNIARMACS